MSAKLAMMIDWDALYYTIRTEFGKATECAEDYKLLAAAREVSVPEYVASLLTRSIQHTIDITFESQINWRNVFVVGVRLSGLGNTRGLLEVGSSTKKRKVSGLRGWEAPVLRS